MHIQQYQSTSEKVLYMFFTCLAILIFACKNISNEHVSRKGQEQVFDNISMGYDQLKDSKGIFALTDQDYFNKYFCFATTKNDSCRVSFRGKYLRLKKQSTKYSFDFGEEEYSNDSLKLRIRVRPIDKKVWSTCFYNAEISILYLDKIYMVKAFGSCDSSNLMHR